MARKKDTPQKAALREMMGNYLKKNNVTVKDGTDVNSIMRDMMSIILEGALDQEMDEELGYSKYDYRNKETDNSRNGHSQKTMHTSYGDMEQEPIVVRLYQEFLDGKTTDYIKRIFEREGVKNWDGGTKWQSTTLMSMLENEKYKGDALLQKSYTVDFLTKKRTQNKGEIQMFYVEDDHDAIISKRIWECVQLEIKRRKKYLEEHGTNSYSHRPESNPFASKIICGDCNKVFARKGWRSSTGVDRKVWQCSERYKVKGVMGCANRHVEEETLIKAYLMAWNALVENRENFMEQWTEQLQSENLLESYRAEKFIEYTDGAEPLTEMDTDFMLKTLDHIKVFEDGTLLVVFLDGTEIECKNEEE